MEPALASSTRRRGHQHHPRHATRRRLDASSRGPAQCGPAGLVKGNNNDTSSTTASPRLDEKSTVIDTDCSPSVTRSKTVGARWHRDPTAKHAAAQERTNKGNNDPEHDDRRENVPQRLAQCSPDVLGERREQQSVRERNEKESCDSIDTELSAKSRARPRGKAIPEDESVETRIKDDPLQPEHAVARARGDGNSDDESQNVEEDPELAELAKLRCPSERAEVQAEREAKRGRRCADYPGLAFGSSIFSSDTMMKFSLIRNELQNIMGNQLKRVSIAR